VVDEGTGQRCVGTVIRRNNLLRLDVIKPIRHAAPLV